MSGSQECSRSERLETTPEELYETLFAVEQEYIMVVLSACFNNKTRAAKILGISRQTLKTRVQKKHGELFGPSRQPKGRPMKRKQ